jgi:TolB protein
MARVFISYSRQDVAFANRLATSLADLGADVWIDVEDIPAGMKWSKAIQQGLTVSEVMLVVISPDSMASSNVEDEWQYYLDKNKTVIPVLLRPAEVHFQLSRIQYVDFHKQDYTTAFAQLYSELKRKGVELKALTPTGGTVAIPDQPPLPARPASIPTPPQVQPHTPVSAQPQPRPAVQPEPRSISITAIVAGAITVMVVGGILLLVLINALQNPPDNPDGADSTQAQGGIYGAGVTSLPLATLPPTATPTPPPPTVTGGGSGQIVFASKRGATWQIYVMDVNGANVRQLTSSGNNYAPVWSPDGTRIAFDSDRYGDRDIFVMNADGSHQAQLTSDPAEDREPAWSPDGSLIAFQSDRYTPRDVFVMNPDGSNQRALTNTNAVDALPDWSPDGTRIVFASDRDGRDVNGEIYVMDTFGGNQTRLTNQAGHDFAPMWSPDGRRIVFYSERDGNRNIYLMNADGSNQIRLTSDDAVDESATWTADGTQIVFVSYRSGSSQVYIMNADGGNVRQLTDTGEGSNWPDWH